MSSETDALFKYYSNQTNYRTIRQGETLYMTTAKSEHFNEYHFHWRLHFFWTVAVICFVLAKLWWLIPLPGYEVLPPSRTYPANFLDTFFLTIACALATRSIVIGLLKSLRNGIHPDSIIAFGSTGGFAAMWSCIKHRSGTRYFLVAMLVTACTFLGSALAGELQSTVRIYYKLGGVTSLNTAECQHVSSQNYMLASSAYASGLITNTINDATSLLNTLNASQPMKSFTVSIIKTSLAPIQNVTFLPPQSNTSLLRRHYLHHKPTTTESAVQNIATASSSTQVVDATHSITAEISATTTESHISSAASLIAAASESAATNNKMTAVNDGTEQLVIPSSATGEFNQSSVIAIFRNNSMSIASEIKLNVFRYGTPDGKEAVVMYSLFKEFAAGVYVNAMSINYTCQSRGSNVICDEGRAFTADNKVVADAMVAAIRSGDGLYGTNSGSGLAIDIVNGVNSTGQTSKLADSLFANPLCYQHDLIPSEGNILIPYSAARLSNLAIVWLFLFLLLWIIGVLLIGYTEHTWTQLATTGNMLPQIISKSPNMFESNDLGAKTIDSVMYLDQETGRMTLDRVYRHGYSITTAIVG